MKKQKISILQMLRHFIQLIFFILLPGLYISAFSGVKQLYLAFISHSFALTLVPQMIEAISIIPVTILLGRSFCGWMCSMGSFGDLIYSISKKLFKRRLKINEKADYMLRYVKYAVLVLLIAVIWTFNITTFASYNPWDVFGMVAAIGKFPDFSYIAANLFGGLIIFILIIIGSMFVERFFCRYLCPMGAIFALTSKIRIAKISKPNQNCGKCRVCTSNCAMGLPLYKDNQVCSGECIQCMKCITACPRKNITIKVTDKDVRPILVGAAAVTVMTGFYYAGNAGINAAGLNKTSTAISSTQQVLSSAALYKDGTYEGTGTGFRGAATTVSVVVKNGKISDITTVSYGDDTPYYNKAYNNVTSEIINSQSADVDSVSGATFSSKGIMSAVQNALSNAKITISTSANESQASNSAADNTEAKASGTSIASTSASTSESSSNYKDGTYTGTGTGFRGGLTTVSVVVKNGKITDVTTVSTGDDKPFYERAFSTVTSEIISSQSADVDSVSGATFSSRGIMSAVQNALSNAQ